MSKVKIQGNASGTGVVTLTAPNTNTDRTITLPDDTQTLIGTNASGNVGIGTASPAGLLHISGSTATTLPSIVLERTGSGSSKWDIKPYADTLTFRADATTDRLTITNDGLTFNGDSAAANALDDYEEGTWTPVPVCTHNCGSWSITGYTSNNGTYTKIGRMVYFYFKITVTSISGTPSNMGISGLPFPAGFNHTNTGTAQNHDTGRLYNQESISSGNTQINVIRQFDNGNWYYNSSTPTIISGSGMYST